MSYVNDQLNELIRKKFGLNYSDVHVWRLLGKMGFSSQKPERQAKERDEEAVQLWRKKTWPKIKKKPMKKDVMSGPRRSFGCSKTRSALTFRE